MLWLKAFHIMAVVAWFAGLFYLPRLFVYHADAKPGSELSETFKVMEHRLLTAIMTPAMAIVWLTGLTLAYWEGAFSDGWLHAKLALVFLLSGFQGALSRLDARLCRRPQHPVGEVLSHRQRGPDRVPNRDRAACGPETLLTRNLARPAFLLLFHLVYVS